MVYFLRVMYSHSIYKNDGTASGDREAQRPAGRKDCVTYRRARGSIRLRRLDHHEHIQQAERGRDGNQEVAERHTPSLHALKDSWSCTGPPLIDSLARFNAHPQRMLAQARRTGMRRRPAPGRSSVGAHGLPVRSSM